VIIRTTSCFQRRRNVLDERVQAMALEVEELRSASPPGVVLGELISGCLRTQAVRVTAKLGIPDLLRDGPKTSDEIAAATGTHEPSLRRLLRTLTSIGILAEDSTGHFAATPMGELLRADHPQSARAFAILMGEPIIWRAWGAFDEVILTGEPAFERVFGEPFFDYCDRRPAEAAVFNAGMTSLSRAHLAGILAAYDFPGLTKILDVASACDSRVVFAPGHSARERIMTMEKEGQHAILHDSAVVGAEADLVRRTERQRLRALVDANMEVADQLHADDFQLINPFGGASSKEQYLSSVGFGQINYRLWEPDEIQVRIYGEAAIIRYQAQIQILVGGNPDGGRFWHTDSYEKRDGRWKAVWSQATRIT